MRRCVPSLVALCLSMPLFAQRFSFQHYGLEQGLTNLTPHCLLQDRLGFLWVGTRNGIFRYDGRKFVRYGVEEGVPAASVESIHETEDGTIWAGTTAGLVRRPQSALAGRRFESVALPDGIDSVEPNGLASDTK